MPAEMIDVTRYGRSACSAAVVEESYWISVGVGIAVCHWWAKRVNLNRTSEGLTASI